MKAVQHAPRRSFVLIAIAAIAIATVQCGTTAGDPAQLDAGERAFAIVYEVLQHARCKNCHPSARVPLQGDASTPHAQNVQGGSDGKGRFALRCANCHFEQNGEGLNMPPGAPNWHLPSADMPLVFEGRSPAQLAQQLRDPRQNGNRTPQELLHHVTVDPLVLWGWNPGEGRTPVAVPHAQFVAAFADWIGAGCPTPR